MARWSQENFFKYMREHFGLDALVQYGTEEIPATVTVLNPAWRKLDGEVRKKHAEWKSLQKLQQNVGLAQPLSEAAVRHYEQHQGELQERIEQLQSTLDQLKQRRKQTPRQIPVQELPEADRFTRLRTERKYFLDTIKMIAYRAETSMASTVREKLKRSGDARALPRQVYDTEVDPIPDLEAKTLTVCLHHLTQAAHDTAVRYLCEELTPRKLSFPARISGWSTNLGQPKFHEIRSSESPLDAARRSACATAATAKLFLRGTQVAGLDHLDDESVLRRASEQGRILVSHDKRTMPRRLAAFVALGGNGPGVLRPEERRVG